MDLDPREAELVLQIRSRFRYGEITVQVRDGLPYRILRAVEFHTLD